LIVHLFITERVSKIWPGQKEWKSHHQI